MDTLEYIEAYFTQSLDDEQRKAFEMRCQNDEAFAQDVAFYIAARSSLKEKLLEQKREAWKKESASSNKKQITPVVPVKKLYQQQWFKFAAACTAIILSLWLFYKPQTVQQLADNYINQNLLQISQTMDGSRDSIPVGINAYNNKDYEKALRLFLWVAQEDSSNSDAKKYAGLVYLVTNNYDKALEQFDELANMKGLFSNPGLFLKAITLLKRNNEGDAAAAKKILQQVVDQNLDGSKEAAAWLKKLQATK